MQDLDTDPASIGEQVISSSLWMVAWRWSARVIGLVTTVILARLLFPEDFGIVAIAGIVAAFFTMMIDLGTDSYLIRHEAPDRDDYDTAWTLRLVVMSMSAVGIFLAAQPGANFFDDPRLVNLIRLFAVVGFLSGFTNIGMTMYRRNLQFREIAIIGITQRLSATATTLVLAFWLKNYWAIVLGESVFALVGLVLSYTWHPYRPRINFSRVHQQWEFSKWILVRNLGTVLRSQGDGLIIAKFFGVDLMGIFTMASRLASLPTLQLIKPVMAPIFSGLAKKQDDRDVFVASVLKVIGAVAFLTFPAATLFAALDEPLVYLILGGRWDAVVPLVVPLIFTLVLGVLGGPIGTALTIEGRVKLLAVLNWIAAIVVLLAMLLIAQWRDLELLLWVRLALAVFMFVITCHYFQAILGVSVKALFSSIYRPALASLVMALIIHSVTIVSNSAWIMIIAGVVLGGVSYILMSGLLWRLAGSPDSGEALLVRKLGKVVAGISNRVIKPKL
jgi:lipopolysaccharide exporter